MQIRQVVSVAVAATVMMTVLPVWGEDVPVARAPETVAAPAPAPVVAVSSPSPVKIGVVDIRKIGAESAAGKKVLAGLKVRFDKMRRDLDARAKKLEKQKGDLERKVRELPPAQREARVKELEKGVTAYRELLAKSEKEMRDSEEAGTVKFLEQVEAVVKEYGLSHGYALICAKGGIIYGGNGHEPEDLTATIMKEVDAANAR